MAKVRIPTPLRTLTKGKDEVCVDGVTVGEVIKQLDAEYPGIGQKVLDNSGKVHRFINVFLNEHDIRHGDGVQAACQQDDIISIFPAIAGGCDAEFS